MAGKYKTTTKRPKLRTRGLLNANVSVAAVGNENQLKIPRIIMRRAGIFNRGAIYLFTIDNNGTIGLSVRPPIKRRYKRIKLSEGGRFTIPRFLRNSQGIVTGTNVMFLYNGSEIVVSRLASKNSIQEVKGKWESFTKTLPSIEDLPSIISHSISENGIKICFKDPISQEQAEHVVSKLENLVGTELLVERENPETIRISPVTIARNRQR